MEILTAIYESGILVQLLNSLAILTAFWFFGRLMSLKARKKWVVCVVYVFTYLVGVTIGMLRYLEFFNMPLPFYSLTAACFVVQFAAIIFLYEAGFGKKILVFALNKALETAGMALAYHLLGFLPKEDIISHAQNARIQSIRVYAVYAACIAVVFILEISIVFIARNWGKIKSEWLFKSFFLLIPVSQLCLIAHVLSSAGKPDTALSGYKSILFFIGALLAVVGDFSLFYAFGKMKQRAVEEKRLALMETQMQQTMEDLKGVEAVSKRQNMISRDLKEQMLSFGLLMDKSKSAEAARRVKDISETIGRFDEKSYTKNALINSLINYKGYIASSRDIEVDADVRVSEEIPIGDSDVCSIISILFDNAIAATENLSDKKRRKIKFTCYEKAGMLLVSSHNYFDREVEAREKADGLARGLGLEILSFIADKHGGTFMQDTDGSEFIVRMSLIFPSAEPEAQPAEAQEKPRREKKERKAEKERKAQKDKKSKGDKSDGKAAEEDKPAEAENKAEQEKSAVRDKQPEAKTRKEDKVNTGKK